MSNPSPQAEANHASEHLYERQIEDALRESEARYRILSELSPDAILIMAQLRFVYANPAAARLLGAADPSEIAGVDCFRFISRDYHEVARERMRRTLEEQSRGWVMESRWCRMDDSPIDVELAAAAITWQGEPAVQVIARDITERKRAEREREDSLARFTALIENIQDAVLIETENRRIFALNSELCRVFGINAPVQALLGSDCEQAAEHSKHLLADPDRFPARIAEILEHRLPVAEEEILFADGRIFARDYVPITAGHNVFIGHMWRYRDITDRKLTERALRESEERYRLVAQASDDVIWDWSYDTGRVIWSTNLQRVLGWSSEEAGNTIEDAIKWWAERIHPDERERVLEEFTKATQSQSDTWREEYRFRRGDGAYASIVDVGYIGRDASGSARRMVGAMRDVTELERARANAETASQAKSRFLSTLSHELRTPLNAVIGVTDLLGTGVWGALTPEQTEHIGRIKSSAWHLVSLIDEILTFTRAEAGKEEVRFEDADLTRIAHDAVEMLSSEAEARGIALRITNPETPLEVHTDGGKVRQILVNLIGNALKYTEAGSVDVELQRVGKAVAVHVRDTGCGIPADRLEEIFEPFVQIDNSTTRTRGGTGLGLAICRKLATLLGGTVTVASTRGQGSTFTLTLPSAS